MKKVLILGGGGFIGMNIAKCLASDQDSLVTLADISFPRDKNYYFSKKNKDKILFIEANFCIEDSFNLLDDDYDEVYMLASVVGVNNVISNPSLVIDTNTRLILNTINWLKNSTVKKVLFSSTSETYSCTTDYFNYKIPTDEKVPLSVLDINDPRFTYAITKIFGESAFLNAAKGENFETTIVRYHNAFGPDMGFKHVIPHLVERFVNKEDPFKMYGHDQTRSFSFIDDVAQGTILAMTSKKSANEIFHLGCDQEITIKELIHEVGSILNFKGAYIEAETFYQVQSIGVVLILKKQRKFLVMLQLSSGRMG